MLQRYSFILFLLLFIPLVHAGASDLRDFKTERTSAFYHGPGAGIDFVAGQNSDFVHHNLNYNISRFGRVSYSFTATAGWLQAINGSDKSGSRFSFIFSTGFLGANIDVGIITESSAKSDTFLYTGLSLAGFDVLESENLWPVFSMGFQIASDVKTENKFNIGLKVYLNLSG